MIVGPVAGTTRDAIDTHFDRMMDKSFTMIDTAGMRNQVSLTKI